MRGYAAKPVVIPAVDHFLLIVIPVVDRMVS